MNEEFYTISGLNQFIRDVLNSGFPRAVWVCGEIQGYDRGKDKKHVFFELCEKDQETRQTAARIGVVIFAQAKPKIEATLKKTENAFELKDDIEVKFLCKVDFYPASGQVRLIVEGIDPVHTLGKIAQDRQRLIALLKQKGILDKNKELPLPEVILNVGLITSYDSAAYHDFISELKRSGYGFKISMMNAVMQGKNAEKSVIHALKVLGGMKEIDVIVITRGGGSIAELSCFDSEKIAAAIAESGVCVLSGIGHEINTTVTDLAAHTFAKTPTAIAKFLVDRLQAFMEGLQQRQENIINFFERSVENKKAHLKENAFLLQTRTSGLIKSHQQRLVSVQEALQKSPETKLRFMKKGLEEDHENLKKIIHLRLQNSRAKINGYEKLIQMASPENTLRRGFSITRSQEGRLIRSVKDIAGVRIIKTELVDGSMESTII
ncbi:MAG: exodeoxyribonuclease VII large subunit [Candidatus Omnitrophica bacterium]|nr:exodeoxyribonuclease VII large subunit [Candidatus Omnitrophota bacterium]